MSEQLLCELPVNPPRYDPIARRGQDALYFPNHLPDIRVQLKDELLTQYSSVERDEEVIEAKARRGVLRTLIGGVCTLIYCDMAQDVMAYVENGKPLTADVYDVGPIYMADPLFCQGTAKDFHDAYLSWSFKAAARVYKKAEPPDSPYHPLVRGVIDAYRDYNLYVAENPSRRLPYPRGMEEPEHREHRLRDYARYAEIFYPTWYCMTMPV